MVVYFLCIPCIGIHLSVNVYQFFNGILIHLLFIFDEACFVFEILYSDVYIVYASNRLNGGRNYLQLKYNRMNPVLVYRTQCVTITANVSMFSILFWIE